MSYIVDQQRFNAGIGKDAPAVQLQSYLNHKHDFSHPWQLVNVVSITSLYAKGEDILSGVISGIDVTMIWRTHKT